VKQALARLRTYGSPYRRALALGAALTLVDVALALALPWPLRRALWARAGMGLPSAEMPTCPGQ